MSISGEFSLELFFLLHGCFLFTGYVFRYVGGRRQRTSVFVRQQMLMLVHIDIDLVTAPTSYKGHFHVLCCSSVFRPPTTIFVGSYRYRSRFSVHFVQWTFWCFDVLFVCFSEQVNQQAATWAWKVLGPTEGYELPNRTTTLKPAMAAPW